MRYCEAKEGHSLITSLRGRLLSKDTQGASVECGGVGYGVAMSLASLTKLGAVGSEVFVLVHTHLTQDALRLFGFMEANERLAFEVLLGTTGVGPRLALAILSTLTPPELADIVQRGDKASLTRIPGVGGKKAERLLVELRDRLPEPIQLASLSSSLAGALREDLQSALLNLGFAPPLAERAARYALEKHPQETDLATLVREALRSTTVAGGAKKKGAA